MHTDLDNAIARLQAGGHTCVLVKGDLVITDDRRGIRPLMELWEGRKDLSGFSAADKVVGKAAAMLYCLMKVSAVHAGVISKPAAAVLESAGIAVSFHRQVDAIRNREDTGFCPMETAVRHITAPEDAPAAIREALAKLA